MLSPLAASLCPYNLDNMSQLIIEAKGVVCLRHTRNWAGPLTLMIIGLELLTLSWMQMSLVSGCGSSLLLSTQRTGVG